MLEPTPRVLARADQALQILERYKARLDGVSGSLSALEVEDLVTVRDVATVLQRAEMVRRIAEEIEGYVIELGADGRLVMLQLDELMGGVEDDRRLVAKDYYQHGAGLPARRRAWPARRASTTSRCSTSIEVAAVLRLPPWNRARQPGPATGLPAPAQDPARCPRPVSDHVVGALLEPAEDHAGQRRPISPQVEGVGDARARAIKDGLARLAETTILERYV